MTAAIRFGRAAISAFLLQIATATLCLAIAPTAYATDLRARDLAPIADVAQAEIVAGRIPGAVVEIGQGDRIVYRRAFGCRERGSACVPMTPDTVFDLASLTKPIATTSAIMRLNELGKIDLDTSAAAYWPAFGRNGKERITIRELMTHYSGLRADLDLRKKWHGYGTALKLIEAECPIHPPGTYYLYSDINFEVLGEIVRRVSGLSLSEYCRDHIFEPLGMSETGFRPRGPELARIAPTGYSDGKLLLGEVNDPTAFRMGGVAGHAGLFATADDVAKFARMMLAGGSLGRAHILRRTSVNLMTIPESPRDGSRLRGLGWDLAAPFASNRDQLAPVGSYGHTGFTGTMVWIDPMSDAYVIVLTNRTYPNGTGDAGPLRDAILALVSKLLGPVSESQVAAKCRALAPYCELARTSAAAASDARVSTGADVLVADGFAEFKGLRIGLITNQTGIAKSGLRDADAFRTSPGLKLAAIFSPEHGFHGDTEGAVASGMDPVTGLPLYSLYGSVTRPTDAMLNGIDALVFDIQDVGARFYTYVTTMAYAMEAAAKRGIPIYVLDRPNPIGADVVEGPVLDPDLKSFTGYFPMPVRYGMTMGELATMFNTEDRIGAKLHVVKMHGYQRGEWYDATGLRWVNPSPNLRSVDEAALYPGVAMVEGANISVGRGTATPFELVGAPWIDGRQLAEYLNARKIAGVRFTATSFIPDADAFADRSCGGVRLTVNDRHTLDGPELGVEIASALHRLYPAEFQLQKTLGVIGSRVAVDAIDHGRDPRAIEKDWMPQLSRFGAIRAKYLLY